MKRLAQVPHDVARLGEKVSKADLLEAAWQMAALLNDAGSVDDDASTMWRLLDELNELRKSRGQKLLNFTPSTGPRQ